MKIRLCARFIKWYNLDIMWCVVPAESVVVCFFSCNNCRFCNNNVGSALLQYMETPDKAFGWGWGRSSSGVLTKRCEFPRLAHTRGRAVAACERRHNKANPRKNPHRLSLCASWWAVGLHHWVALWGLHEDCGSYGLSLISPNLGVSPIYLASRRRIQAPIFSQHISAYPSNDYTRFTFSLSGGLPCCSRSSLSRALIQVHLRRRARHRRSRLGALGWPKWIWC